MTEPTPKPRPIAETVRKVAQTVVSPTDEQLWLRVRVDLEDLPALTELYRRLRSPLILLAQKCGVSAERADELVNSAFVQLLRRRERFDTVARAFAYLRRCVDRACWRASRADRHRAARELSCTETVATAAGSEQADTLARSEISGAVRAALAELSEKQRLAVELHYLFGWTEPQVGEALGVKPATVKEHLDRAREKLRQSLARWNPTVAGAGGIAVGTLLADAARTAALSPERTAEMVTGIVARVAAGGVVKPGLVLLTVLLLGGAAAAGWALRQESVATVPPRPVADIRPPVAQPADPVPAEVPKEKPETLPARNLRLFDQVVRPRLQTSLNKLSLGKGGGAKITGVDADGARVYLTAEITHGPEFGFTTRLWLGYCMHDLHGNAREPWVLFDAAGTGQFTGFDPRVGLRIRPGSSLPWAEKLPLARLGEIAEALDCLPPDPRSGLEQATLRRDADIVLSRSAGAWVSARDGSPACTITWRPPAKSDGLPLVFRFPDSEPVNARWVCIRPLADGRVAVHGVEPSGPVILSADGSSVEVSATGEKWVRPKLGKGK